MYVRHCLRGRSAQLGLWRCLRSCSPRQLLGHRNLVPDCGCRWLFTWPWRSSLRVHPRLDPRRVRPFILPIHGHAEKLVIRGHLLPCWHRYSCRLLRLWLRATRSLPWWLRHRAWPLWRRGRASRGASALRILHASVFCDGLRLPAELLQRYRRARKPDTRPTSSSRHLRSAPALPTLPRHFRLRLPHFWRHGPVQCHQRLPKE